MPIKNLLETPEGKPRINILLGLYICSGFYFLWVCLIFTPLSQQVKNDVQTEIFLVDNFSFMISLNILKQAKLAKIIWKISF